MKLIFFEGDNKEDLSDKINYIFNNSKESADKAEAAYKKVQEFSWDKRAEKLVELLSR